MTRKAQFPLPSASLKAGAIARALAMGRSHHNEGQLNLAEKCYRQVLALDPNNVDGLHLLGVIAFQSNHCEEGIRLIKLAALKKPNDPAILVNLGAAYRKAERSAEARDAYKAALKLKPDLWEAYFNLGKALLDLEDCDGAIKVYQKCIAIKPADPEAYVNLGNAYKSKGEGDSAIAAYEQALRLSGTMTQAYGNIAAVFFDRGWLLAALAVMDKAIAIDPRPGELRFKRSLMTLRLAQFSVGWGDYESRYFGETERIPRPSAPPPYWAGEDLSGKNILLGTEQGLGDEILYGSMIPDIMARAGRCVIRCSVRMVPVFARSFPEAVVLPYPSQDVHPALQISIDYQIGIPSLGQFLRPDLAHFPAHQGYLKADSHRTEALRERYKAVMPGNLIVGLSWRSKNDRIGKSKSAEISDWAEILRVPGVTFVNLQYGDCADELAAVQQALGITIIQDHEIDPLKNMDDFFAQVAAMDLVVTTSNTSVHVAGSLNVPAWLLLSTGLASLWYWFLSGEECPWYPSVRIFRRPSGAVVGAGPWWHDVVERAGQGLALWVKNRVSRVQTRPS